MRLKILLWVICIVLLVRVVLALPYNVDVDSADLVYFAYYDNETLGAAVPDVTPQGGTHTLIINNTLYNGSTGYSAYWYVPSGYQAARDLYTDWTDWKAESGNISYEWDIATNSIAASGRLDFLFYSGGLPGSSNVRIIRFTANSDSAGQWGYYDGGSHALPNPVVYTDLTYQHIKFTCNRAVGSCDLWITNATKSTFYAGRIAPRTDSGTNNAINWTIWIGDLSAPNGGAWDNLVVYFGNEVPTAAPETDPPYLNINNCAGETASPYKTSDTTPTCNISCSDDSECSMVRVMNKSTSFDLMTGTRNCSLDAGSTGTNTSWACTIISDDALVSGTKLGQNIYFTGLDTLANNHTEPNATAIMNITFIDTYVGLGDDISWIGFFPGSLDEDEIQPDGQTDTIPILNIQNNGTLDSAYLKIRLNESFNSTPNWCYQETANVSTACGGIVNPIAYAYTGTCEVANPCSNAWDGSWDTFTAQPADSGFWLYINYTKPEGANISSLWQVKNMLSGTSTIETTNWSISEDCWNYDVDMLHFMIRGEPAAGYDISLYCLNATDYELIITRDSGRNFVWEEAMWWMTNTTIPVYAMGTNYWWNYTSAIALTDSQQNINDTAISEGENVSVWLWANYSNPTSGYTGKLLFEYTTS